MYICNKQDGKEYKHQTEDNYCVLSVQMKMAKDNS